VSDLTSELKDEIRHLETMASTVLGLAEGALATPARALLKKASEIVAKLDGKVEEPKVFPPVVTGPSAAKKAGASGEKA
jgi:hypothetical protein